MTAPSSKRAAAYGIWPSPISAQVVAAGASPLSQPQVDGSDIYWLAGRASEGGRNTLLRQRAGQVTDMTPAPFNVRTRVHEYGGGACLVAGGSVWFSHFADNRIYVLRDGAAPIPLTHEGAQRHADFVLDSVRQRLVSVREDHTAGSAQPVNTLCAIDADGTETVLVSGSDFYAAPRVSPDGRFLAWLCWDHPRMPWQGTELWLAELLADGGISAPRLIAGGIDEAICQPEWSPASVLHFVSDRTGWWNLYRFKGDKVETLCPRAAEFGSPHWSFGGAMYGFRADEEIVCTYIENGVSRLAQLSTARGEMRMLA
ncbi:MAG: S9 family peptidase, partial [Telluria sp.]